ncbi:WcaF family extracellular polysaccharide biosynthesis acetyltransferase [Daejeonella oryzae]|uniref:WcaF family extracellular polysaccharide biosynthesis acetyltransferase n=1 Tax=Daejeonella oryzae TaxID=1122943 RepID=UPI000429957E|nr:WcaF family extracellular polysaccharide biosynthesis acetyltransferase [Daejeonella oryzae]
MNKTQLKKRFDKKDFDAGASSLKIFIWYFISTLFFRSGLIPFSVILVMILRLFGAKIGRDVRIKPFVNIKYPWKLSIDDHTWIGENCCIENLARVSLEKNVCLSQGCMILTGNHDYKSPYFDLITREVYIEEGAWIGAKSVVCPGIRVFSHAILTVGSIATQNLEAYTIYQGNPAVKVRIRTIE